MKTKIAAGVGFVVFCAGVALAANHGEAGHDGHKMMMITKIEGPKTRTQVQARVKEHFAAMDQNKDGFVTTEERTAMHAAKMAEMQGAHFSAMDTNKDGSISRAEFDAGHLGGPDGAHEGHGAMGMGKMDHAMGHGGEEGASVTETKGPDGKIMRRVIVKRHDGGMMMERADANNDGKVSLDEAMVPALARFDRIDTDKDGTISDKERAAAQEVRKERRMKWRDRRG
jgi:EF hand